jgi:hypothetical protein
VRKRAANHSQVQHSGLRHVIREMAVAGDQTRVFATMDFRANEL